MGACNACAWGRGWKCTYTEVHIEGGANINRSVPTASASLIVFMAVVFNETHTAKNTMYYTIPMYYPYRPQCHGTYTVPHLLVKLCFACRSQIRSDRNIFVFVACLAGVSKKKQINKRIKL